MWEFDAGEYGQQQWEPVGATFSTFLDSEVARGANKIVVQRFGFSYEIDFHALTQTNMTTGRSRKLRNGSAATTTTPHASTTSFTSPHSTWAGPQIETVRVDESDDEDSDCETGGRKLLHENMYENMDVNKIPPEETCCVCLMEFEAPTEVPVATSPKRRRSNRNRKVEDETEKNKPNCIRLNQCHSHYFHYDCISKWFQTKPRCPSCSQFYGEEQGIMPYGSEMTITRSQTSLPGYEDCGCIEIYYSMPSGTQECGTPFYGTSRRAFLPDNKQGNQVLSLLKRAFRNRVTFTIGQSVTTGMDNCVIWNGIHHKTNPTGGPSRFGYPDPTYLNRVTMELAAKGIVQLEENEEEEDDDDEEEEDVQEEA